jgi:hypothetical protein
VYPTPPLNESPLSMVTTAGSDLEDGLVKQPELLLVGRLKYL